MAKAPAKLTLMTLLLAARLAVAASDCEEGRTQTGLSLAVRDAALRVASIDTGSTAATSGARPDDVVLQVNGVVPHTCSEWAKAVRDARSDKKALLLLVGRADAEVALVLGRRTWGGEAAEGPAVAAATPPPAKHPAVAEAPPPLPDDEKVSVDSTVAELSGLVVRTREGLGPYGTAVTHARRAVETLAARKTAPPETVTGLRKVARLHEAAVLAWTATDGIRERNGMSRRVPVSEALTAPYFSGSPEQAAIDEFDFLREAVAVDPKPGRFTETSGEWRPAAARRLLWEHAGEALGGVAATLAAAP